MKIDKEFQDLIPKLTTEEFSELEKSILKDGCRDAICLWKEPSEKVGTGIILDGHNRYKICMKHNLPSNKVWIKLENRNEAKSWIIENQFARRNLNKFQRGELVSKLKEIVAEQAKERQRKGGRNKVVQDLAQPKTRDILGEKAGISHGTIDKIKIIKKEATEETIEKLRGGEVSIDAAFKEIKKEEKTKQRIKEVKEESIKIKEISPEFPSGQFQVIVIDPPWKYPGSEDAYDSAGHRATSLYPTMDLNEIENLKIPSADDCILFLWTTNTFLHDSFHILETWGFTYKVCLTWNKINMGIGTWLRSQTEHILIAVKGKPYFDGKSTPTIFSEKRREHSRKPEEFYKIVEKITEGRRLDYFARTKRNGWEFYGNEISKF